MLRLSLLKVFRELEVFSFPMIPFFNFLRRNAEANGSLLILDEIQSGYGRTGKFFAHQYAGIRPHLITTAKGMGNGFPVGGVLIHADIKPWSGMLGTTFGGNYLASAASLGGAGGNGRRKSDGKCLNMGEYLMGELKKIPMRSKMFGEGD